MLKCVSLYTYEIDDPKIALEEILAQLDEKITLLENSVGIIMCHTEFISSGVLKYIAENLPFDLVGMTTSSQAINGEIGELMLTIFLMTSDDVQFRTGATESVCEDIEGRTAAAFGKAAAGASEIPKLALLFSPYILSYAGDAYVDAWKQLIPDTPIFGALATDDTLTFEESATIYNGQSHKTAMSFVLCYGKINPRFLIGTLPTDKLMPYKGEVTKSSGPFVQEINNINAYKYFESINFTNKDALPEYFIFVPFLIDPKNRGDYDGVPVVRGHASFLEDGTAVFTGNIDEGSTFTLLKIDSDDVLSTTRQKMEQINELPDVSGVLIFPCIVRRMMTMRSNPLLELEAATDIINPDIPFMMGYAGGEICPTSTGNGEPANRFQNYSLIVLVV